MFSQRGPERSHKEEMNWILGNEHVLMIFEQKLLCGAKSAFGDHLGTVCSNHQYSSGNIDGSGGVQNCFSRKSKFPLQKLLLA